MPDARFNPAEHGHLLHLEEADSTNAEAMRLVLSGCPQPFWVLADRQTAGRGRSGRAWTSLAGNFHGSLAVALDCPVARAAQLALVAGVAVFDAIEAAVPGAARHGLQLKWPNDVLIGEAKVGGVLVETSTIPGRTGLVAIVGIGLNLAAHPEIPGRPATHLGAFGHCPQALEMHAVIASALGGWLARWEEGTGFAAVREAWLGRAGPQGEPLAVEAGGERITGAYAGLDAEGALLLSERSGQVRRITYGDVTVLATVTPAESRS